MKLIGSRKSLLFKTAGIGLIATLISFILLYVNDLDTGHEIRRMIKGEAEIYFKSIQATVSALTKNIGDHAVAACERDSRLSYAEKLNRIKLELNAERIEDIFIWYVDRKGNISFEPAECNSEFPKETLRFHQSGLDNGNMLIGNKIYDAIHRPIADGTQGTLVILFPIEYLYGIADRDSRIRLSYSAESDSSASALSAASISLTTFDGKRAGSLEIQPRAGMPRGRDISGWTVIVLGLMPLLGFGLVGYFLYRYFESFAEHSAIIRQILKREKPGAEIFRRDQQLVKNNMPELSEIFSLIDENLLDKARINKSLDIIRAALFIIQEKGNDPNTISEIIELIVNTAGFFGGAIFSIDHAYDRVEIIGKYNFNEVLLSGLSQTAAGSSFIKYVQKQGTIMIFSSDDLTEEPWRKLFEGFRHAGAIPLSFKGRTEGLLVLTSLDSISESGVPPHILNMIGTLLSDLMHGIEIEREKLARYDQTMILQETSLAISSKLDLQSVLQVVASRLTDYADATYCMILLNTDFENIMDLASFYTRRQQGIQLPESSRVSSTELPGVAEALAAHKALIIDSEEFAEMTATEQRFFHTETIKLLTILPISHSAKSIGVVILGEERSRPRAPVSPDKLSFIQAIVSQAASAIENARLYSFINNKVDQLTTLYNAGAAIQSEIDPSGMLDKVLTAVSDYLSYSIAAVFVYEPETGHLQPMIVKNMVLPGGTDKVVFDSVNTVSERAAVSGKSLLIGDFRVETDIRPSFQGSLSEMAAPIKIGDKIIGVLTIGSQSRQAYAEVHESFLRTLAAQLAIAMERNRLFEQERERGIKLDTIFEFSKKLSQFLNVQEVIKAAGDSIREAFDYELVAIFVPDQVKSCYSVGYQASSSKRRLPEDFTVAENRGLLGEAINSKKAVYRSDVNSDPDYVLGVEDVKSEVCIPIILGDEILGVLDVESLELDGFTAEDISTLEALTDIMAVAIKNSYLFEESIQKAERLSLIDNINKAISATLDLDSFFRVVARAVSDNAGYRWTGLVVPEGNGFVLKSGYTPQSAGPISTENMLNTLQEKLSVVIKHSAPEFISFSEMAHLGAPENLHSVIKAGIKSLALFPIGDNARAEAVMIVGSSHPDGFSPQELQLLKDLAVHLRIAWQNAQLFRQLKTAYEQLQEAQERIIQTEKLRALGEMSSGVVHDFNNVLAAIIGRLQIITRKLDDYENWSGRRFLNRNLELIEKAANDGAHILSRIREFTGKKLEGKFVEVRMDRIINDTIELTRPRWHDQALANGRSIKLEFKHDGDLQTSGNPTELREVFTNLINNAVDAISGDGQITIDARTISDKEIRITLEDSGSGMTPETSKKIFEPFFTTKGTLGTGLGLSVTYGIILRHKGTIDVETEPGRGTKFTIRIPIRGCGQGMGNDIPGESDVSRNILVVDDDDGFRELLASKLVSCGHKADVAPDAGTALEKLKSDSYDLVITDLGMSGLSGWELADAVHELYPGTRIVMATGWGTDLNREDLAAHHVDGLIEKPCEPDDIMRIVDDVLTDLRDGVLIAQN